MVTGIADGCRQAGAALIGGETAEMPGIYSNGDYDLAGFCVGIVERENLLPRTDRIAAGDRILGLASSGPHSNGYSLIRKILELGDNDLAAPAPFASGPTMAEALLAPTRIYVAAILDLLSKTRSIKALAHITGGGFTDNLPRVLPDDVSACIDLDKVPFLPVFDWIMKAGGIAEKEMLRTFNCGVGLVLVAAGPDADAISAILEANGESVADIGEIVAAREDRVVYRGTLSASRGHPS